MNDRPELVDTHCHLAHEALACDLDGVLARAGRAGVRRMICAAGSVAESRAALSLARTHRGLRCLAGIHPHEAAAATDEALRAVEQLAAAGENVAVGEIGLDYHYDYSPRPDQRRAFAAQLDMARRLGRLVVVHTREAFDDTMAILRESNLPGGRVVIHCCTEPPEHVREILDLGAAVSFSGIVTFRNAGRLRESAELVPDDKLLVETDSPYCSPEPVRKMRTNEPANVVHVAARLAAVRNVSPAELAEITTANAVRIFGLAD
ncbi:MAG: TatD family hydrolase [Planctomycetes bacterium]|nr:TatD family hydrolase [Planctomycetota bacterium]